jgi:hypothetical protein
VNSRANKALEGLKTPTEFMGELLQIVANKTLPDPKDDALRHTQTKLSVRLNEPKLYFSFVRGLHLPKRMQTTGCELNRANTRYSSSAAR